MFAKIFLFSFSVCLDVVSYVVVRCLGSFCACSVECWNVLRIFSNGFRLVAVCWDIRCWIVLDVPPCHEELPQWVMKVVT